MRITYDSEADAMYIELRQGDGHVGDELEPGVVADYDAEGHVLGLEILDARRRLGGSIPRMLDVEMLVNEPAAT